ncbi:hypothetical protein MS3_00004300 [Schistosoma haematobium]|uniref:Trematode PH-like domain-containing protein n=1 Tax=Schistosoma haematobium TaxID=6185 RepID=A0A094ZV87_SCHHA|nr:hypothetical protein MS3_00004300 [Schistosoma haematobium]KAH9592337.1 hypothetical protein MS3_00004300 [Schistosoma haematobium]CAH8676858.1 unnamed protein product [Schistosoma haematobium]
MTTNENNNQLEINQSINYTESIYHLCYGYLIHDLKIKNKSQLFDRTIAENEIDHIKPICSIRLYLLFCKDCLRIKRYITNTNRYKRYTLYYKQIEVYYFTPYMKNVIILGILSPNGLKRSYQYIYIKNNDDHFKIQTILNQIFENSLKILTNMPIIGQLIIKSFHNESIRSKRLGQIILDDLHTSNDIVNEIKENDDGNPIINE